jgi:flagellar motor switch protein FliM
MIGNPFTKNEIELLLESARSVRASAEAAGALATGEPFDFEGLNRLSAEQTAKLLELNAEFAKRLGQSLSTLLGPECKTTPVSVELMTYGALVSQSREGMLFETLRMQAPEGSALLQAELPTVLPMIDLLLGGNGAATDAIRPLTLIEREIFKPIMDMVGAELQAAWAPLLQTTLHVEHCSEGFNLLPRNERVSSVKFEIQIGELRGVWVLILPMRFSNALIRKLEPQQPQAEPDGSEQNRERMKQRLLDSKFLLELFLPPSSISVRKLAHLKAGQVVVLKTRSNALVNLNLAGINLFQASPVSCGTHRGAQIRNAVPVAGKQESEAR